MGVDAEKMKQPLERYEVAILSLRTVGALNAISHALQMMNVYAGSRVDDEVFDAVKLAISEVRSSFDEITGWKEGEED